MFPGIADWTRAVIGVRFEGGERISVLGASLRVVVECCAEVAMSAHTRRFEVSATDEDDPAGAPLLSASLYWNDSDRTRSTQAVILRMRGDRLLLLADGSPSRGSLAVIRLGWPLPVGWATALVTRARRTRLGPWEIHLRMTNRPSATFRMLRHGDPERQ